MYLARITGPQLLVALAFAVAVFWLSVGVPLGAEWQQQMQPWASEAAENGQTYAWDALLWDGVAQVYPWRVLLNRALRSGELPLWNPYQYCGYPIVGNGQSEVFYPPNWLLLVIPAVNFLAFSLALHCAIALVLTYLYCRQIGLGHWGAAFAGLAFAMGGFFVTWSELPALVNSLTWLPGCLLGIELIRGGRRSGVIVLAGCLGLSLLAGHMQIVAYVWLTAGMYALVAVARGQAGRRHVRLVRQLGLAFGLGLMLGCAQLLPTMELGNNSSRGSAVPCEAGWRFQQQRALQPAELVAFVWPFALGNPANGTYAGLSFSEHCGYVGLITLLMVVVALIVGRDWWTWGFFLAVLALLSVIMGGPLARLMYFYLPKLGLMGSFSRLLSVYTLLVAILGGLGLDALLRRLRRKQLFVLVLPAVVLVCLLGELFWFAQAVTPRSKPADVYPQVEAIQKLQSLSGPQDRVLAITPKSSWRLDRLPREAVLPPNAATVYELYSVQGYDSLVPRNIVSFAAKLEQGQPAPVANGNMMLLERTDATALGEASVRWVLSGQPVSGDGWALRWQKGWLHMYENTRARPLVWIDGGKAHVIHCGLNSLHFAVTAPGRGDGVVSQTYYPGWRQWSDGGGQMQPQPDGPFWTLSCHQPAEVRIDFWPNSVVSGLFLTLVALSVAAGLVAFILAGDRDNGRHLRDQ